MDGEDGRPFVVGAREGQPKLLALEDRGDLLAFGPHLVLQGVVILGYRKLGQVDQRGGPGLEATPQLPKRLQPAQVAHGALPGPWVFPKGGLGRLLFQFFDLFLFAGYVKDVPGRRGSSRSSQLA